MKTVSTIICLGLSCLGHQALAATVGPSTGGGEFSYDGLGYFGAFNFDQGDLDGSFGFLVVESPTMGFVDIDGMIFNYSGSSVVGTTLVFDFDTPEFELIVDAGTASDPISTIEAFLDPFTPLLDVSYSITVPSVNLVPLPATLPLGIAAFGCLVGLSRRKAAF
jgi:hypothetical protein